RRPGTLSRSTSTVRCFRPPALIRAYRAPRGVRGQRSIPIACWGLVSPSGSSRRRRSAGSLSHGGVRCRRREVGRTRTPSPIQNLLAGHASGRGRPSVIVVSGAVLLGVFSVPVASVTFLLNTNSLNQLTSNAVYALCHASFVNP